jgi:5-oxoprolinase (ATP-hydrolysing)
VYELDERVLLCDPAAAAAAAADADADADAASSPSSSSSSSSVYVEKAPCKKQIRAILIAIKAEGIRSIAVALLHSYLFKDHEEMVLAEATSSYFGDWFEQISLSSHVMPMARLVPRGCTTCVDAYLTPVIKTYLASFMRGFDDDIKVC